MTLRLLQPRLRARLRRVRHRVLGRRRTRVPRRPALALAAVVLVAGGALAAASSAEAGSFRVSQCAAWNGAAWSPRSTQASLWTVFGGFVESSCGAPYGSLQVGTANWRLANNQSADLWLALPASAAHTSIDGLWLDWAAVPQAPSIDPANLTLFAGDTRLTQIQPGEGTRPGSADRLNAPSGSRTLHLGLWCSPLNGPGFCNWSGPSVMLHGLTLDLRDDADPSAHASGSLLDGTAQSGRATLSLDAADPDSGVREVQAWLSGARIADVDLGASCADDRLPACPGSIARTLEIDTTAVPDGAAHLRLHVIDLAGNATDVDAGRVVVANAPVASGGGPGGDGPATGDGSGGEGPADGSRGGVGPTGGGSPSGGGGSTAGPAGFPPNPLAGRGHVANGSHASERAHVVARLSGGGHSGRRIAVDGRTPGTVRGRVFRPDGEPIGRALLTVVERRPGHRWTVAGLVRTRADGHYAGSLPGGPTRDVVVAYHAFGDTTTPRRSLELRLTVRTHVTLTPSGRRLHGRVSRPVPRKGVLVTIERRIAGRWTVARHSRTDDHGRFACPAPRGEVRATVPGQAGYGYAAGHSRRVRVG